MSTWGDKLLRDARPQVGVGVSVSPADIPEPSSVEHTDWRKGLVSYEANEDVSPDAAVLLQDVEATNQDALVRAPGIGLVEDVTPRDLSWLFEHASIDFATSLIALDPPYIGVKTDADMVFTNEGIAATGNIGWNVTNVAGILLFSNGQDSTYLRDWATGVITDISAEIIAQTFGNAFGRTFAGAYTDPIDGLQALGIRWDAASADPADWTGLGSGEILLISNQPEADRIVALRPIGFDVLGVLTRKNLWLGYPTNDSNEPADFRIRFPGIGCVAERTAVVTPDGVIFLSDSGVAKFNINEAEILSGEVNNLLLPIDYQNLDKYYAIYNKQFQTYQLYTPTGTWIYQLKVLNPVGEIIRPPRWFFRSYVGDSAAIFTPQNNNLFWSTVFGTWLAQTLTWAEMSIGEELAPPQVYVGQGSKLGVELIGAETYFDDDQDAYWTSKQDKQQTTDIVTTQAFEIEYLSGNDSEIEFSMLDEDGAETGNTTVTLPSSNNKKISRILWAVISGTGTTMRLRLVTGSPEIFRVRHVFDSSAPTLTALG